MELATLAWAALILFVASFVQGVTGFGFGITAMALLPLVMGFHEATLLVAVLGLAVNLLSLFHHRGGCDWRLGGLLLLGAALGSPLGVYVLQRLDDQLMVRALGALIFVFSAREVFWAGAASQPWSRWSALPLGVVSGLFGSAFNIGGPPAIVYVYSQEWSAAQRMSVLQLLFLEIGILRVGLTATTGQLSWTLVGWSTVFLVPMGVAVTLGHHVLARIPSGRLKRPVFVVLLLLGLRYLIAGH